MPPVTRLALALVVSSMGCLSRSGAGVGRGPSATAGGSAYEPGEPRATSARLSAGQHATCLVGVEGTVTCWGPLPHTLAQVSKGASGVRVGPATLAGAPRAESVVIGDETCVVDRAGAAHCLDAAGAFVRVSAPKPLRTVAASEGRPYALARDGALLRRETTGWATVAGFERGVVELSVGLAHACLLRDDERVYCWGRGEAGLLGDPKLVDRDAPTPVEGLARIVRIATRRLHTCALRADGRVLCWGLGDSGQLGDGLERPTDGFSATPVEVRGLDDVSSITVGNAHTCALRRGHVLCWGARHRTTGDATDARRALTTNAPAEIPGLDEVVELAAGGGHQCALRSDGSVWCWGVRWWVPARGAIPATSTPERVDLARPAEAGR